MLEKYNQFMNKLLKYGDCCPTWDYFMDEILTGIDTAEMRQLIMSVCGPYSIPEYAVLNPEFIPVILYSDDQKGFMIQFETSTIPIFMYELDLWLESLLLSWEDVKDGTEVQLEHIAKELVCHAVNSYFTGMNYEKHADV